MTPDGWIIGDELVTFKAEIWRNDTEGEQLISEPLIRPCN